MNEATTLWEAPVQGIQAHMPLYDNDYFVSTLILCFFIFAGVFSDRKNFLGGVFSSFFLSRNNMGEGVRTANTFYMKLGLFANTFASTALFIAIYMARKGNANALPDYQLLLMCLVASIAAYLLKQGVYKIVNWVFFDKTHMVVWQNSYAEWIQLSGLSMYAICTATIFLDLCTSVMTILLVAHLILTEICLFFKGFRIFLAKKYGGLHLFLYLCTLEIIPLLLAGKLLDIFL
jgi:hypothetical protein